MKRKQMTEKSLTVQEAYDQFQRYNLTKGLSAGTISYYESYSRVFFTFLEDTNQPLSSITKDTIDDYTLCLHQRIIYEEDGASRKGHLLLLPTGFCELSRANQRHRRTLYRTYGALVY